MGKVCGRAFKGLEEEIHSTDTRVCMYMIYRKLPKHIFTLRFARLGQKNTKLSAKLKCDIKVLILLFSPKDHNYLGYIPNEQIQFVDCIRKVIQQVSQSFISNLPLDGNCLNDS